LDLASTALDHARAQAMFAPLVDAELPSADLRLLRTHLSDCAQCQVGLERYERAVQLMRQAPPAKVPGSFASVVLRRVRRRRRSAMASAVQGARFFEHVSIPAEAAIPIVIAAVAAAILLFALP
jgi:anti-sigma factor RsiW